jgi:hypothetical protein
VPPGSLRANQGCRPFDCRPGAVAHADELANAAEAARDGQLVGPRLDFLTLLILRRGRA